jgi:hypothetical protein
MKHTDLMLIEFKVNVKQKLTSTFYCIYQSHFCCPLQKYQTLDTALSTYLQPGILLLAMLEY